MRRSGVRIPLAPPQADIRSGCRFFVCLGALMWCLVLCCLASLVFRAPHVLSRGPGCSMCPWAAARPRDRHTRAFGSEWSISRPALALPPPTGTAAGPCHRPRAPQPGPATAHRYRGRPLRSLRHPPHRRRVVADVWLGASARSPARPRHRPRAPQPGPPDTPAPSTADCCRSPVGPATHVKPSSPLLACAPSPVKPTTPLQARYTCFRRNFGEQRRHGFHGGVLRFPHWC